MIATCYQIDDALQLTPLPAERAAEECQRAEARIWIDLHTADPGEVEGWLERLGIGQLSRQLCVEARDRSGFYPLKEEIILVLPVLGVSKGSQREVDYLAALCRQNLLLTLHSRPVADLATPAVLEQAKAWLPDMIIRCGASGTGSSFQSKSAAYRSWAYR